MSNLIVLLGIGIVSCSYWLGYLMGKYYCPQNTKKSRRFLWKGMWSPTQTLEEKEK